MIIYFILTILVLICLVIGVISTIRDGEYGAAIFCGLFTIFVIIMLCALIDAETQGNKQVVERYFPAEHYKMEVVVTESRTVINDSTTIVKTDTTYVITGVEQIVGGSENYDSEYVGLSEYEKPLKSTERKYVKNRNH